MRAASFWLGSAGILTGLGAAWWWEMSPALIDRAKQRRWVELADLERAFTRNKGTWGTRAMRRLLDRTGDRAHSELERIAVSLLRAAGITGFEVNYRMRLSSGRPVEFDIAFTGCKVAVELDGYAYHAGPLVLTARS